MSESSYYKRETYCGRRVGAVLAERSGDVIRGDALVEHWHAHVDGVCVGCCSTKAEAFAAAIAAVDLAKGVTE